MNPTSLRTEFSIPAAPFRIQPGNRVLAMGSCFAESIGHRLLDNKLPASVNPFGTLFQPLAIFNLLQKALRGEGPDERQFLERDGRWVSYEAHSEVWGESREALADVFGKKLRELGEALRQADVLLLTLGSAWAYRLAEPPVYVANNHKQPAARFERDLLSVKEVCKAFGMLHSQFRATDRSILNSQPRGGPLSIVLTVSPVRHTRDGMADNAVSKSVLRAACHYLTTDFPEVYYFPAYELLLDDLRDYRFYAPDGLHPSPVAEEYIFDKFREACFSEPLNAFVTEWQSVRRALAHRPFDAASAAHRAFLERLRIRLLRFGTRLDVRQELAGVEAQLEFFL